ncbi:hypothetical protein HK103_006827 [Boothiomyces macroporosus]|uniref:Uncharacterized protein n=1 Tax=Boothiomyces macroporosus TaxID=261099 RepID=A0AAD5UD00_9FUNG|nr:hypothetical protein HK103_006827 [Boothiomyces macroporosus]
MKHKYFACSSLLVILVVLFILSLNLEIDDVPIQENPAPQYIFNTLQIQPYSKPVKKAYMFYLTNRDYACCSMMFAQRFKEVGTDPSIDIVGLYTNLDNSTLTSMHNLGMKTIQVQVLESNKAQNPVNDYYKEAITKLQIFNDWGYDRFVFLDADILLLSNIDHLFDLPDTLLFWAPRAYWLAQPFFTTTVIVGKPSKQIFDAAVGLAKTDNNLFDMDVLNMLYKNQIGYLPNLYGILNKHFLKLNELPDEYKRNLPDLNRNLKLVHFTDTIHGEYGKPWRSSRDKPSEIPPEHQFFYDLQDMFYRIGTGADLNEKFERRVVLTCLALVKWKSKGTVGVGVRKYRHNSEGLDKKEIQKRKAEFVDSNKPAQAKGKNELKTAKEIAAARHEKEKRREKHGRHAHIMKRTGLGKHF